MSALGTPEQLALEAKLIAMLQHPDLVAATERVRNLYLADPVNGATPAGTATAESAAVNLVAGSTGHALVSDPARPVFFWGACAPHSWHGLEVPGTGYGIDNPDNVHRRCAIDGVSTYRIRAQLPARPAAQFSFISYGGPEGELPVTREGAEIADVLLSAQVEADDEGRFEVTVGPEPVPGSRHHLTSTPTSTWLLVRDALTDWETQEPLHLEIDRIAGPDAPSAPTDEELVTRAVAIADRLGAYWLAYDNEFIFSRPVNTLPEPRVRPFGAAVTTAYEVAEGHGLFVVIDPLGSDYVGVEVTDPWGVTRPSVEATGGLNNRQLRRDADGLLRYWIGPVDPGVHNWVDTGGIDAGILAVRWQGGAMAAAGARAVVELRHAPVAEAAGLFPAGHAITAAERADQLRLRRTAFERRLAPQ
ncbi:hypothetical protein [Nocardioides daejeonensis]|uniref:hypothetical protein n=1 Tax=Nocardioides daejeonensis TaxID=1046556 RepID=UPI000D7418A3|nr:hypothetical protein [Nocardioides daejeonensis]